VLEIGAGSGLNFPLYGFHPSLESSAANTASLHLVVLLEGAGDLRLFTSPRTARLT
jgi:hypothetical protein